MSPRRDWPFIFFLMMMTYIGFIGAGLLISLAAVNPDPPITLIFGVVFAIPALACGIGTAVTMIREIIDP